MQEAFLKVWERWDRVSAVPDPVAYLYRTAFNVFRSRLRRAARAARRVFGAEASFDPSPGVEDRQDLLGAHRTLAPRQRSAVVLMELMDLSSEDAARILHVRPVTVRVLASQGRAAIKRHLEGPMDELRPMLERLRDDFTPARNGFEELVALRDRKRRRQRSTAVAVALAVGIGGILVAGRAFDFGSARGPAGDPDGSTPAPPVESTFRGELVATFPVGEDVRSVVYGEGSVWVAVSNNDGTFAGRILRIDPATNETLATIPVETIPTWEVGGGAMVVADGSLWVTGGVERPGAFDDPGGGADAAMIWIDASTNEVVQTFGLGGEVGADLTFLDGDLWVLLFGDETVDHSMEVVRVDPSTGEELARIPLTTGWAHTIVAAGGHLLVLEGGRLVVNQGGQLTSIDPKTDAVGASAGIPSPYSAEGPVVWRDELWAGVEHGFARFDTETGELIDRFFDLDPSRLSLGRMSLEADDRGIWFLGYNGVQGGGPVRLALFDPEADTVVELVALEEGNPVAIAVAPDSVWILNVEGTLTRVDLVQD
jgi:RNA polymerase sigma-70 factor (ECF subfamily)